MSFNDLFDSGKHKKNLGHFASIVTLAAADGTVDQEEEALLKRFARRLDVDDSEFNEILKTPNRYPINPPNNKEERLERLFDLFRMIFVDHEIDEKEDKLVRKYAIGLGFDSTDIDRIVEKSKQIFSGKIQYEDYEFLINKK